MDLIQAIFGKQKSEIVNFYDIKYSKYSQFSYPKGKNSCTYCCLECCLYILNNVVPIDENFSEVSRWIAKITSTGASNNRGKGFTSCDECFKFVERYKSALKMKIIYSGQVKDNGSFLRLLENIVNFSHKTRKTVTCILTKPPETILIIFDYDKRRWIIYDSHKRYFEKRAFGAAFYFFKSIKDIEKHLKILFPIVLFGQHPKEYEVNQYYNLYEATVVVLRDRTKKISTNSQPPRKINVNGSKLKSLPPPPQVPHIPHIPHIPQHLSSSQSANPQLPQHPQIPQHLSQSQSTNPLLSEIPQIPQHLSQSQSANPQLPQIPNPFDLYASNSLPKERFEFSPPQPVMSGSTYTETSTTSIDDLTPSYSTTKVQPPPQQQQSKYENNDNIMTQSTVSRIENKDKVIINLQKILIEKSKKNEVLKREAEKREKEIFFKSQKIFELEKELDMKKKELSQTSDYVSNLETRNRQLKEQIDSLQYPKRFY